MDGRRLTLDSFRRMRRKSLVLPVLALLALTMSACIVPAPGANDVVTAQWPTIPSSDYTTGQPVTYTTDNGTALHLQVFTPTQGTPPANGRPVIVYLHGGGWYQSFTATSLGSIAAPAVISNNDAYDCYSFCYPCPSSLQNAGNTNGCEWIGQSIMAQVTRGWVVVDAEYSLDINYLPDGTCSPGNTFPSALQDAKSAIRWVQSQPGIDPNNVVVAGTSAGGTLAALVALTPGYFEPPGTTGKTTVKAAVSLDGPNNLRTLSAHTDNTLWLPTPAAPCGSNQTLFPSPSSEMTLSDAVNLFLCGSYSNSSCLTNTTTPGGDGAQLIDDASPIHWVNATSPPIYIACSTFPVESDLGCSNSSSGGYNVRSSSYNFPVDSQYQDGPSMAYALVHDTHNDVGSNQYQGAGFLDQAVGAGHATVDQFLNFTYLNGFLNMPTTTVALPADSSTLHGGVWLDATAYANDGKATDSNASGNVSKVQYVITGGSFDHQVVATQTTESEYGWFAEWNTSQLANGTSVPDGNYVLQSIAYDPDGNEGISNGVRITINN
jgi:acetyl esterase/lipase